MKKLLLFSALLGTNIFASSLYSAVAGMTMKEVKVDAYTIDTAGVNPRVYEFRPEGNKGYLCVVIFPNSDGDAPAVPAMQCFKDR